MEFMSIVLRHQVEASEHAADDIEKEIDSTTVPLCYEIQSLMSSLVAQVKSLGELVQMGHASMKRGEQSFDARCVNDVDELYRKIELIFGRVHHIAERLKRLSDYRIDGKDEFYLAWADLRAIVSFSLDAVRVASNQADRGEGRELMEFMHELHH